MISGDCFGENLRGWRGVGCGGRRVSGGMGLLGALGRVGV